MFRSLFGGFFKPSKLTLDNFVFRLHYRVTVGLLLTCAVALLWKINLGTPIRCEGSDIEYGFANDHCWYQGTFTNRETRDKEVGVEVPYPGIDKFSSEEPTSHNMHRWVVVGILVQAAFFYLPRIIWKSLEGRRVHRLIWNMNDSRVPGDKKLVRKQYVSNYLRNGSLLNFLYVAFHVLCEALNLLNVVVQLFLVSHILQVSFATVGVLTKSRAERTDVTALEVFPMHTKCSLYKFGTSGDVRRHSLLCIMTINGVMEAIFVCQWIWFALLSVLSVLALVYRVVSLLIPQFRALRLEAKTKVTPHATVENVTRRLGIGEWFLLYMLSKNLDPVHMRDILDSLADGLVNKQEMHALSML